MSSSELPPTCHQALHQESDCFMKASKLRIGRVDSARMVTDMREYRPCCGNTSAYFDSPRSRRCPLIPLRKMLLIVAFLFLLRRYSTTAMPVFTSSCLLEPLGCNPSVLPRDDCPGCHGRIAWDIVWSCLATTFAVTWVSVHPNVPFLEETSWMLLKRRIFLMCLALLAPEVMIMWAFKQWRGAAMIKEIINKARPRSCHPWTMAHAHFLQMSGFKLCTTDNRDNEWANTYYVYQQTKCGIVIYEAPLWLRVFQECLAEGKIDFPDISEEEINDRSKGDALSKGFALLQITWFIVQLIARAIQHLTITELELTTAALAGLNSIMYLFWWSKPLDIRCPIIIRTKKLERLLAERAGQNNEEEEILTLPVDSQGRNPQLLAHLINQLKPPNIDPTDIASHIWTAVDLIFFSLLNRISSVVRSLQAIIWRRVLYDDVVIKLFYLLYLLMILPMDTILNPGLPCHAIGNFSTAKDKIHNASAFHLLFDERDMRWIMSMMFYSENAKTSEDTETRSILFFSASAGAVFGLIHCLAWDYGFPSSDERILWRAASLSIVGACLCIILGTPLRIFVCDEHRPDQFEPTDATFWKSCKRLLQTTPSIVYSISRLSLLILALLSLRDLPASVYATVAWTEYFPHI